MGSTTDDPDPGGGTTDGWREGVVAVLLLALFAIVFATRALDLDRFGAVGGLPLAIWVGLLAVAGFVGLATWS